MSSESFFHSIVWIKKLEGNGNSFSMFGENIIQCQNRMKFRSILLKCFDSVTSKYTQKVNR